MPTVSLLSMCPTTSTHYGRSSMMRYPSEIRKLRSLRGSREPTTENMPLRTFPPSCTEGWRLQQQPGQDKDRHDRFWRTRSSQVFAKVSIVKTREGLSSVLLLSARSQNIHL